MVVLAFCLLRPAVASGQAPVSRDSVQQAITRGVAYFEARKDSLTPDAFILYHYLAAKFGLHELMPVPAYLDQLQAKHPDWYASLQPFLRIVRAEPYQERFLALTGGLDDITAAGVWYDRLTPKKELLQRIAHMDFADGYNVTHAFLATTLAETYFGGKVPRKLKAKLLSGMDALIAAPALCDMHIEAIALRQFAAADYVAPAAQMRQLLAQQLPNGGWLYCAADKPEESHHTAVLALWALLGYKPLGHATTQAPFLQLK